MQCNAKQAPFRGGVHGKVQHWQGLHLAVDGPLDHAAAFFKDKGVIGTDERYPDRLGQSLGWCDMGAYLQGGVEYFCRNRVSLG